MRRGGSGQKEMHGGEQPPAERHTHRKGARKCGDEEMEKGSEMVQGDRMVVAVVLVGTEQVWR